ncbi:hypothetical protein ASPACDRAFT_1880196 [Aspergillus aculeatus ATCC 16872]|uniref:Transcription factor domain-containing protein n=1 Tax=Aspergillus aculeatus (strain ATCC 16872 / CBS 172.66 / WB 5094) TaxID=690307 RepID=A0A1L9WZY0_ASPA1|nr:uncharacterized protein ASPACDRAFT_1880196 [Aspergillus aculeatus ATCC 16872]OJK01825.1 hypothetical protein ASPACDRAFT_1880196 [Aspergillus aculeatus ATCC 16872]
MGDLDSRGGKPVPACEKCRILKVKCVRSGEGQPYVPDQTRSVFFQCRDSELGLHNERDRCGWRRLVDLETKLSNIIGLLSRSSGPLTEVLTPPGYNSQPPAVPDYPGDRPHRIVESISEDVLPNSAIAQGPESGDNQNTLEAPWDSSTAIDAAWVTNLGLSPVALEHLLERFRGMASYFPFVRLPGASTAASMTESRPFLLLAAVGVASSNYCHLQDALTREFRNTLSERAVTAGEKNLDLLQGLLVHLAWFHFAFVPGNQQAYQYLHIAISMVIDLRLDQQSVDLVEQQNEPTDVYARDACRAYLGCYYMSSIIAMSSGKPNNLRFHKDMLRCATMLQLEPEFETDLLIYPITQVLQFNEDVCETYRMFADLESAVLLIDRYHAVKIRIQELGLVYCYGQRRPSCQMARGESTILSTHPNVINNLTKCVSSAKGYLQIFCALPAAEQSFLPFSTWYQVILAVFVLYRLSVGLPEVPQWSVDIARQTVDLQECIDQLRSHLQGIKPLSDRQIPSKSLFSRLPEILESVGTSYTLAKENAAQVCDSRRAHHELKASDSTASPTQGLHRCPAVRYSRRYVAQIHEPSTLQGAIATEVRSIEDETLWGDLFLLDTLSSMTGPSPPGP